MFLILIKLNKKEGDSIQNKKEFGAKDQKTSSKEDNTVKEVENDNQVEDNQLDSTVPDKYKDTHNWFISNNEEVIRMYKLLAEAVPNKR